MSPLDMLIFFFLILVSATGHDQGCDEHHGSDEKFLHFLFMFVKFAAKVVLFYLPNSLFIHSG